MKNKMAEAPINKLIWKMGLPMIISMVLQALYNVVDSIFVSNIKGIGGLANTALTIAFPIQILIIAIGVGTGIGLNTMLSKSLGEKDNEKVNNLAGTGIFLSICIYLVFLIFGLFGSKWFISLFTNDSEIIKMGSAYLQICTCFSFGAIGYTVYERLLQSTGKTNLSTIAQISGAVTNVVLDYIFIYPMNMGISGAAIATILGQIISLLVACFFHYKFNKEISGNLKYIKCNLKLIKEIYKIGISAALMQALLSVMMAGMNAILGRVDGVVLVGAFGIYYKIQQIALFSAFGLSNTIISLLSFNYGMKDKDRTCDCIKYGIISVSIVTLIISLVFEVFAHPLSSLFGMSSGSSKEIIDICTTSLRISSIGFIFMGFSVMVQGILQSLRLALKPLLISFLRLVVFVFPIAYLFTLSDNVTNVVWWTFPITEVLTAIISFIILKRIYKQKIETIDNKSNSNNLIICISRQHGTNGKEIARLVSKKLNIKFFDKEEIKEYALKNSVVINNDEEELYNYYLSLNINKEAIIKQSEIIKRIASENSCVIVGRASDYILKGDNVIKIYLYAPMNYRIKKVQEIYKDSLKKAKENILKSDKARSSYYEVISNRIWGDKNNYDLCLNCEIGNDLIVKIICDYVKGKK